MVQLSKTRAQSKATSTAKSSAKQAAAATSLGYEVLYGRRPSNIQVPLSVPNTNGPYPSTGSALLDSFVSEAIAEPAPLQHLRLVNVANRRTPATPISLSSPKARSKAPATAPPLEALNDSDNTATVIQTEPTVGRIVSKAPPATSPASEPANTHPVLPNSSLDQLATPEALSEQPPAAAEPATIPLPTERPKPVKTATSAKQAKPAESSPTAPVSPAPAPRAQAFTADVVNDSKIARDSAAAVGLIDINDTLLFGGDHQNLASTDPFIDESAQPDNDTGVLSYLSQQISAFTVSKLKSGFPNNTDPRVINRPDPPKHQSVLDIQTFKLGALDEESITPSSHRAHTQTQLAPNQTMQAPEINILSQQVNILNRKIAELSQKLAQVTQAQANG